MSCRSTAALALLLLGPLAAQGRIQKPDAAKTQKPSFEQASVKLQQQFQESLKELTRVSEQIAAENVPLSKQLNALEAELSKVRAEYQEKVRGLDTRNLDLNNLRTDIKTRRDEANYLQNLLSDYIRNFESRLHIVELQRYEKVLDAAKLALENTSLSEEEVYAAQIALLAQSIERLHEAAGGICFEGTAVDSNKLVKKGSFVLVGPAAIFRSADGKEVGTAEQRLGSLEPAVIPFANPEDALAAGRLVETGQGSFPLDPTQGNAHKIEATQETFWEHVQKGGPVMVPIFVMAGLALLIAVYKWLVLSFQRRPAKRKVAALMEAVAAHDTNAARQRVAVMRGPVGRMLAAGVEHLEEPKELIEEAMYETVLTTRLKLNSLLPFIAICAASAPLLGLLGTVTGIINTFKMITVFGSGDVKSLSGGISEALITTKFGLIVAIPSLLLHAFLLRKARGVIGQMEKAAVVFVNQFSRIPFGSERMGVQVGEDPDAVRRQVKESINDALNDLIIPAVRQNLDDLITKAREEVGAGANEQPVARDGTVGSE